MTAPGTPAGASPSERPFGASRAHGAGGGTGSRIPGRGNRAGERAPAPMPPEPHAWDWDAVSPERPLVFIEKQQGAFRLHALDADALALGLAPGMALADARARVPGLIALPHDPAAEAAWLEWLADLADRYTPMVALDPPDGLILDIAGCAHLFGGEAALADDAVRLMRGQGLRVRHACAATPEAALALARYGSDDGGESDSSSRALRTAQKQELPASKGIRAPAQAGAQSPAAVRSRPGLLPAQEHGDGICSLHAGGRGREGNDASISLSPQETAALRALPLIALRVAPDVRHALRAAGFVTLGDLADLPPAPLAARFGATLVERRDRLLGRIDSRIIPRRLPPPIHAERRFAEPIAHVGTVMAVLGDLLGAACAILAERRQGGRRFAARLYRSDGAMRDLAVETGRPVRDPAIVLRLFDERVETLADPLDPGFGFDIVRLAVPLVEALEAAQDRLDGARDRADDLAALLDRLAVRAGPRRFRRLAPRDTHMPERATRLVPVAAGDCPGWDAPEPGEPPLRPLALLDPPERIEVIAQVPDGPPRQFRWRRGLHRIVRQEGPERIAPEWWRRPEGHAGDPGLTRDYYRVEDESGRRFWLFRHGLYERETDGPDWYVHGLFA